MPALRLMGLWRFVIAKGIDVGDATEQTRAFLERIKLNQLKQQDLWPELHVLVRVKRSFLETEARQLTTSFCQLSRVLRQIRGLIEQRHLSKVFHPNSETKRFRYRASIDQSFLGLLEPIHLG